MTGVYRQQSIHREAKRSFLDRLLDVFVPGRAKLRGAASAYDQLAAFSSTVPMEYCGWDQTGMQALSDGFSTLLGTKRLATFEDFQAALNPGDAAALDTLYSRLQNDGEHFECLAQAHASGKTLKIFGKRSVVAQGRQVFSVLWALDSTDVVQVATKSAEALLRLEKREQDLRASLNALPFAAWTRDVNLDLTWCNKFYARVVEDTAAAVVADQKELPMNGLNRADPIQRALAQRAMTQGTPQSVRAHIIADGERRLVEVAEIPLPQERQMIGIAVDVTKEEEWMSAYERLVASHNQSMEQLRAAVAMFGPDTRLEFYNSAYEQLTGMSASFLDGRPKFIEVIEKMRELRRLPEQADYRMFKHQWINRFTSLLEPHEEMQYLPDGSVVRLIAVPRPMGGLLFTHEDVTSRLQLETDYNTLIAVQQETMDNLSEGIAVFGEDGRLKLSNKSFSRMWQIDTAALEESPHITTILEQNSRFFGESKWAAVREEILGNALEREMRRGRLQRSDGIVLEYSVVPLPDGNILNTWFDVTDTIKVEQALMEKNAALQAAERLKTDFLANVSYQLRTPLNAMMGFTEMLSQQYFGKLNERQLEYTSGVIEAGQRLVSLINDILDLSTIEAGYLKLYPSNIPVRQLLQQVSNLTGEWARKQNLRIDIDCAPDVSFMADERRVKQVLLNLISNAINHSPNGGILALAARKQDRKIIITVRDTGLGIAPDDLARVFTPFENINSRKASRRGGAGLGLALVRSIVELHGGGVSIESKEGAGTMVTCVFPEEPPENP